MSRRLRAVIFDVDGTLVDSQDHIAKGVEAAFAALGRDAPGRSDILGIVGLSLPEAFAVLAPWADAGQNDALVEAYKASYVKLRAEAGAQSSPLFAGAREMLERLKGDDHLLLGIATGKSRKGLDILLQAHGLEHFFDDEQVADHHPSKPHPAMLEAALKGLGVEKERAVMVGDTSFDMEMAQSAGMKAIGVTWGYHARARLKAADRLIDRFEGLPGAMDALLGEDA